MKIQIGKHFEFEASHRLVEHKGKCSRLHGHRYELEVKVEGEINANGWICDFGTLDKLINELVIEKLDHQHLNDQFEIPTAENIALWIFNTLKDATRGKEFKITLVRLYETRKCFTEITAV